MNDDELGKLIVFLTALRNSLLEVYRDGYRIDMTLGSSASGDYTIMHVDITLPKQKRS